VCRVSPRALAPRDTLTLQFRYSDRATRHPLLVWNRPAMYIDPTTGSLVLQFIAAGVLSILAMFARVREALKSFLKQLVPRRRRWAGKP
jgi:hypothetical protein